MFIRKLFTVILVIFSLSLLIFAQDKKRGDDKNRNEQQRQEELRRQQEEFNKTLENVNHAEAVDLSSFLPKAENSWSISVTATGGFTGGTRLLAAINSDGNYLCHPEGEFKTRFVSENALDSLTFLARTVDFSLWNKNDVQYIKWCNDCSYMTMSFTFRDKKSKFKTYRYSRNDLSTSDEEIRQIYERVIKAANCK